MWKQVVGFGIGIAVGAVVIYVAYNGYKKNNCEEKDKLDNEFAEKLKDSEARKTKLKDLLATQTYVELLTVKELTSWFRENRGQFKDDIKMLIAIPTTETLMGLGYPDNGEIDSESNILQLFYDENISEALSIRLVNFTNIDPNLQSHLIEEDGLIVVTD